jgi:hypothetical protein
MPSEPTTSDSSPFVDQLPPELRSILTQHKSWGATGLHRMSEEPPFLGPLAAAPTQKESDRVTDIKPVLKSRMFRADDPADLDELTRILQQCAESISRVIWMTEKWTEARGLQIFLIYDTPTRQLKTHAISQTPVSTR